MPSKSNGILLENQKPVYDAGEIVFAKLKGYPWWPAKIVGEYEVPESVLKVRKKLRGKREYTIYFYGSLDYAFFNSPSLRVFDPDQVRHALLDNKFLTIDLSEAIQDALDPNYLFDWEQQQLEHSDTVEGDNNNNDDDDDHQTTISLDNEPFEKQQQHTIDIPVSKKESTRTLTKRPKKRILDVDNVLKDTNLGNHKRNRSDTYGAVTSPLSTDPPTHKSQEARLVKPKSPKAVSQSTPEYERIFKRIYLARHKLQKLIYHKKPGTIAAGDYPKIDSALKYIEDCEMTRELLKRTKIGKVVRFGSGYAFLGDKSFNLQDRCLELLKVWTENFLGYHEHTVSIDVTAAVTTNGSIGTTVADEDNKPSSSALKEGGNLDNSPTLMNNKNSAPSPESSIITNINSSDVSPPMVGEDNGETYGMDNTLTLPPSPKNSSATILVSKSLISTTDPIDSSDHNANSETKTDFIKLAPSSTASDEIGKATGCDLSSSSATVAFLPDKKDGYDTVKTSSFDTLITIPPTIQPVSVTNSTIGIRQLCEADHVASNLDNSPAISPSPIVTSSTANVSQPPTYTSTVTREIQQSVNTSSNSPMSSALCANLNTPCNISGSSALTSLPTKLSTNAAATSPVAQKPTNKGDMARNNFHDLSSILHPTMERDQATTITESSCGTHRNKFDDASVGQSHYDPPTADQQHITYSGFSAARQPCYSHIYNYNDVALPPQHQIYGQAIPNYYHYAPPPTWSQVLPPMYHSNHTTPRHEQQYRSPFYQTTVSTSPGPQQQQPSNDSSLETHRYRQMQEIQTNVAPQMTTPLISNLLSDNNNSAPMIGHLNPTSDPRPPYLHRPPSYSLDSGNGNRPSYEYRPWERQ